MIHRRRFPTAATLLACAPIFLAGCGDSGGVSAVPVKGEHSAAAAPQDEPAPSAAPSGSAAKGGRQLAPLDVEE